MRSIKLSIRSLKRKPSGRRKKETWLFKKQTNGRAFFFIDMGMFIKNAGIPSDPRDELAKVVESAYRGGVKYRSRYSAWGERLLSSWAWPQIEKGSSRKMIKRTTLRKSSFRWDLEKMWDEEKTSSKIYFQPIQIFMPPFLIFQPRLRSVVRYWVPYEKVEGKERNLSFGMPLFGSRLAHGKEER